jgi:2-oxoglutarate dehydrogenase E2 component (dihydrolipoamide succinyltransferase)
VAILGVHRIAPRPVVRDGEVVVRPMGNLSLTFDHRVADGARAAAFTLALMDRLAT